METLIVYGKSLETHLLEAISLINREIVSGSAQPEILVQGLGTNINKALAISSILEEHLQGTIIEIVRKNIKIQGLVCPVLELRLQFWKDALTSRPEEQENSGAVIDKSGCISYLFYQLLLDRVIEHSKDKEIEILRYDGSSKLARLKREPWGSLKVTRGDESDQNIHKGIADALYRVGFMMPDNIFEIARKLGDHDDIILGLDTNILYNCNVSQHLLPIFSILNLKRYFPTPNWILLIVPSAVMHELEEAANIKNEYGYLQFEGRLAFRALQEIFFLAQNAEIPGVSLLITGEANPVLDTIVDLQGLRDYMFKKDMRLHKGIIDSSLMPKKRSTGDMIIRDQFKSFLRKIDFHKGTYFITADKSNAALAETEGLNPIFIKSPYLFNKYIYGDGHPFIYEYKLDCYENRKNENFQMRFPISIGELIYEMAVAQGTIKIVWQTDSGSHNINLSGDCTGEKLENWVHKKLFIKDENDRKRLLSDYDGIPLEKVVKLWSAVFDFMSENGLSNV